MLVSNINVITVRSESGAEWVWEVSFKYGVSPLLLGDQLAVTCRSVTG